METFLRSLCKKTNRMKTGIKGEEGNDISLLAIEGCDLEAKASVVTVNSHDRRVVQVRD